MIKLYCISVVLIIIVLDLDPIECIRMPYRGSPRKSSPSRSSGGYNYPTTESYRNPYYDRAWDRRDYTQSSNSMWQRNNGHSVRNSVLAGLGGSALGLYLGHKLGGISNTDSDPNDFSEFEGNQKYSVVHHYYQGDRPIPKDGKIEADIIKKCENVTFCTTNTTALCLSNGTIYCIADLNSTTACEEISAEMKCVSSTVTLPCNRDGINCNNTTLLSIPCVSIIEVFSNSISIKRAVDTDATTTMESASFSPENNETSTIPGLTTTNNADEMSTITSTMDGMMITTLQSVSKHSGDNSSSNLMNQDISNKYCVTVIAEPIKKSLLPPYLSNAEFMQYASSDSEVKAEVGAKFTDVFGTMLNHILP